jgi:ABC-type transport system involved in multi-copper enzyme maturation permease subunit
MRMSSKLAQLWAIARYEFRIHWRRRGLKVMLLSYLAMQGLFFLVTAEGHFFEFPAAEMWDTNTDAIIFSTWPLAGAFLLVMFPFVVAEAVPRDRQFGVRELLDSLPLPRPVYLAGKVLGAWFGVASAALAVMALAGIVLRFILGPYGIGLFLAIMLVGANLLIMLNSGLAVLAAAGQPNVVRALLVGLACTIVLPLILLQFGSTSPIQLLNPLRLPILYYYMGGTGLSDIVWFGQELDTTVAYALTVAGGLLELVVAGLLAHYTDRPGGEK